MPESKTAPTHEESDLHPRAIVWFAVGLAIAVALVFVIVHYFEYALGPGSLAVDKGSTVPHANVPSPRLQVDERKDLEKFRAAEDEKLRTYGWVDRPAGVVRIPIDRAMDLLLERGLPARAEAKGGQP